MKRKIIDVNYGLASSYSDGTIEVNNKIQGDLRRKIIAHEKRHTAGSYSYKDYKNDFQSKKPYFFESLKLAIKNPEMLIGFFPVMYSYHLKTLTFNQTAILPFFQYGVIFTLVMWLFFGVNMFNGFIGWFCLFTITNVVLLIFTHLYMVRTRN